MKPLASIRLYYTEGSSDKEYHAELLEVAGGNVVNFRYGRRGTALTCGTKTATPVDLDQARAIYDKLVASKTAKGYTPVTSGTPYQYAANASLKTDFLPQLLNPISEDEAMRLLNDPAWAVQEKMDGERRAVQVVGDTVTGINRKGLVVPLPQGLADELLSLQKRYGDLLLDGEQIGERLYVFDLHVLDGQSLRDQPWLARMDVACRCLARRRCLIPVPMAITTAAKQTLWNEVEFAKGEGLVFKRHDATVSVGRPNSGGDWLKFKFTESASCCVLGINPGKRSIQIGVMASFSEALRPPAMTPIGNVTIPPNQPMPNPGQIVEVAYLYAYKGGSLYQPVYRGTRPDRTHSACTLAQLKYKPEGREEEDV